MGYCKYLRSYPKSIGKQLKGFKHETDNNFIYLFKKKYHFVFCLINGGVEWRIVVRETNLQIFTIAQTVGDSKWFYVSGNGNGQNAEKRIIFWR